MIICITGVSGYVGSQIVRTLFQTEHQLVCLVRDKEKVPDEIKASHKVIRADITKPLKEKIECDVLIHCAAMVSDKTLAYFVNRVNVEGTKNILEAVSPTAKVIFISCGSVYNISKELHRESEKINQALLTPYGRSKFKAETLLEKSFSDRSIFILRPQHIYGPKSRSLMNLLLNHYKNGVLKVAGDLDKKVSMCSIFTLVDVVVKLIDQPFSGIQELNVADKKVYNLRKVFVELLLRSLDRNDIEVKELNETFLRVIAGIRTVLVPGNHFTQGRIDLFTRDHLLDLEKMNEMFPKMKSYDFFEELDEYSSWIHDHGIQTAIKGSKRIYWS